MLTVYNLPSRFQLALLLEAHDCAHVKAALRALASVMLPDMAASWFRVALTDNGREFSDEDGIGAILGESAGGDSLEVRLYYCDPRQARQGPAGARQVASGRA